jgi:hypothetical protein
MIQPLHVIGQCPACKGKLRVEDEGEKWIYYRPALVMDDNNLLPSLLAIVCLRSDCGCIFFHPESIERAKENNKNRKMIVVPKLVGDLNLS